MPYGRKRRKEPPTIRYNELGVQVERPYVLYFTGLAVQNMDDNLKQSLVRAAIEVAHKAYAPYSEYYVGAALLAKDGTVYSGCNVENASYPVTICAERGALMKAVSEGCREFTAIAVVSRNAGTPCGMCRQMLYEFAPDLSVILADLAGNISLETTLSALLPHGFGPSSLKP